VTSISIWPPPTRSERVNWAKQRALTVVLRRSPSTDVCAADYGCFLVYETLDCSGELRRFQNLDQVEDFLAKREQADA
jgi:hypothetical protein